VDGVPHDKDFVSKDDIIKRRQLQEIGYRIFSIRHSTVEKDIQLLANVLL
jgi:hypothetical protein